MWIGYPSFFYNRYIERGEREDREMMKLPRMVADYGEIEMRWAAGTMIAFTEPTFEIIS